jgi:hypothetical protein
MKIKFKEPKKYILVKSITLPSGDIAQPCELIPSYTGTEYGLNIEKDGNVIGVTLPIEFILSRPDAFKLSEEL